MGIGSNRKHPQKVQKLTIQSNMTTVLFINLKPWSKYAIINTVARFRMFLYENKVLCKLQIFRLNHSCTFYFLLVRRYLWKSGIYHIFFLVSTFALNKYLKIILWLHSVYDVNYLFICSSTLLRWFITLLCHFALILTFNWN